MKTLVNAIIFSISNDQIPSIPWCRVPHEPVVTSI